MNIENNVDTKKLLQVVAGIYNTMHLFDFEKGVCHEIYAFKEVHDFFENYAGKLKLQELIHLVVKSTTTDEYLQSLLEFTDFSSLQERIAGKRTLSFDFVGKIHGWTRSSFIPAAYDSNGKLTQVIYTTRNIQADKVREEELLEKLDYDERTGVYNRRAYERDVAIIEAEGMPKYLTAISFDVNGLNDVNRKLGVAAGDELVKGAAECIRQVFGEKGKIYRIGGDEFNVLIDCELNELIMYLSQFDTVTANWKGNLVQDLTVSKGCAAYPEFPKATVRELQAKADQRMYQEKEQYYENKKKDFSSYINDPGIFSQIMQKSFMGLVSYEFEEYYPPRLVIDDYIKSFLGFPEEYTPEQLYEEWINRIHPDYSEAITSAIEKIIIGNQTEVQYPWFHPKVGITYVRSFGYRDPTYTKGVRVNGFLQNITHLVHLQKDTLTGFYTKETFFQKADEILKENPDKHYRFFVSDIENFKAINDRYGLELSDKLLQYLAKSLKIIAPNLILSGRITSDVLVCMQEDIHEKQTSEEGKKIQNDIIAKAPIQNFIWKHGIYYTKTERNISAQKMCDRARSAVESIKGNYQINCAVYDDTLAETIKKKQLVIDNMEEALKNKEFQVYLQPKHDLHTNKTGGAEALVRWIHPEIGFMNPGDFIPVFETNGFVKNVDEFVFNEICSLLCRWIKEGKPVVPISVNLSRRDFEHEDLAKKIIDAVDKKGIPHELLHFELTESAFTENPEHIISSIKELHDSGFVIELDDFGSGYSSLTSLTEIDFDILKLDMSIIKKDDPSSSKNVLDICSQIVKQMNLKSVAEGVENEEQLSRLKDLGCDYIQGYYFSKPLPIADFEKYLGKES